MEETLILAPRICAVCGEKAGLLFCTGCRVVHYCGRKHQEDHRPAHKSACNAIKKATLALEKEETKLRSMLPDVFDTQVGRFWGIVETRDYMMTRFVAAKAILRVNNVDAVEKALSHLKDMLRLCRSDNLGMRDIVPFLHLRLGQEQECYDFLKSWLVDGSDGRKPNTDIRDADAFELQSLPDLKLVKTRGKTTPSDRIPAKVEDLQSQYLKLCQAVHNANPYIWPLLVRQDTVPTPPDSYSPGSPDEAELVVFNCKRAWFETEDAIVMIDGDTAKFATVYRGSGTATNVSTHNTSRRDVLVLCVERQFLVERVYPPLINKITAKASSVQIAGTVDEAVSKLNQSPPPCHPRCRWDHPAPEKAPRTCHRPHARRSHGGASRLLQETVKLRRRAVPDDIAGRLSSAHIQKALFLGNVNEADAWYGRGENHPEAAVEFTKVGNGFYEVTRGWLDKYTSTRTA
ncbi:hypothetical protein OOU_Y34scaffold00119g4 [Pyricularia oryzae Y34]|uniref:MYND-type domain-containing protein n=1 Tax=Pyricularia oryzae (strain Y34) TaxID=1143189 RepID=A0AA97P8C4_PYRO3|nr:hypothetical protein OOU_Y34scaffold00119g4 [Pyricularia oryzae Y34]